MQIFRLAVSREPPIRTRQRNGRLEALGAHEHVAAADDSRVRLNCALLALGEDCRGSPGSGGHARGRGGSCSEPVRSYASAKAVQAETQKRERHRGPIITYPISFPDKSGVFVKLAQSSV